MFSYFGVIYSALQWPNQTFDIKHIKHTVKMGKAMSKCPGWSALEILATVRCCTLEQNELCKGNQSNPSLAWVTSGDKASTMEGLLQSSISVKIEIVQNLLLQSSISAK